MVTELKMLLGIAHIFQFCVQFLNLLMKCAILDSEFVNLLLVRVSYDFDRMRLSCVFLVRALRLSLNWLDVHFYLLVDRMFHLLNLVLLLDSLFIVGVRLRDWSVNDWSVSVMFLLLLGWHAKTK